MTQLTLKSCRNQGKKGFTLTEIAIVLGIIGIILGAVWSAASGVYLSANSTKFQQGLGQYLVAVRAYCSSNSCVASTAVPTMTQAIPNVGASKVDPAAPNPSFDAAASGFTILWDLPTGTANTCLAMVNAISTISGAAVDSTAALADGDLTPVASTACARAGATPTCQVAAGVYQYLPIANSCVSNAAASGLCIKSLVGASYCNSSTPNVAAAFSLTY